MGKYEIIALIGEAGSGKDYIMKQVLAAAPDRFNEIISCTTRPMREGEVDGINYYYLTDKEFRDKTLAGQMFETANFNGWMYSTSSGALSSDKPNIAVFNPAGIYSMLQRNDINLTVFKIVCSDKTRLIRQLNREMNPNVDEIIRRFGTDREDFKELKFDYISLPNEIMTDLEESVRDILRL